MAPRTIIIDTDPGQDDAVAILLALASPEDLHVLGITVVAGNVPLDLTQKMLASFASWRKKPMCPCLQVPNDRWNGHWSPQNMCMGKPGWMAPHCLTLKCP